MWTMVMVALLTAEDQRPTIELWPTGMPAPVVPAEPAEEYQVGPDGIGRRRNISKPRLFVHRPKGPANGVGVIVVPGGGFGQLADDHEGGKAADWLAEHGITAFALAHRTPTNQHPEPHAGPVQDVQKSVMEVRRRAGEFGLNPKTIGVLGFSAGGQATIIAATNTPTFAPDDLTYRPDFLLLIYAWKIFDAKTNTLRSEIKFDGPLPPTFIAQMADDKGSLPQGSTLLYLELINRKVPAELHIYERGGHGFGMKNLDGPPGPTDWRQRALDWLQLHDWVQKQR